MENLDQLIAKFKEVKEELQKSDSPLHNTVEGFMGGLKTLPKGSAERHDFISSHLAHSPFTDALNAHPQGKQLNDMLHGARKAHLKAQYAGQGDAGTKAQIGHLDSKANAGLHSSGIRATVGDKTNVIKSVDDELDDFLSKAYISPWYTHGPSKPVAKPAAAPAKPARLTGLDRIKAESQKPITATDMTAKKPAAAPAPAPAKKLTGLDRIRAESQKPITATTVKKDEDEVEKADWKPELGGNTHTLVGKQGTYTHSALPRDGGTHHTLKLKTFGGDHHTLYDNFHPGGGNVDRTSLVRQLAKNEDLKKGLFGSSAPTEAKKQPFEPSFKGHAAALGTGSKTNAKGVTTERSFDPLKQETSQKKFINMPFGKTINASSQPMTNSSGGMAMSCGDKVSLSKGGQWSLDKAYVSPYYTHGPSKPVAKPAAAAPKPEAPKPAATPVAKGESADHCSKCKQKPCVCNKTEGVLVDKMDGSEVGNL